MTNPHNLRWGIIGAGIIAHKLAEAVQYDADSELVAVASRTPGKAESFARQYQIRAMDYESLVAAEDIDVVYVATTHNFHFENTQLVLRAGKHALVEKPFTVNANQAQQLVDLAKENDCFLMEAIWTRFLPSMKNLKALLGDQAIGRPLHFALSFGGIVPDEFKQRLNAIELAGGATLDLGIYPISFLCYMLEELPNQIKCVGRLGESGVDELAQYSLRFPSGCTASVTTSFNLAIESRGMIYGDGGHIELKEFQCASDLEWVKYDAEQHPIPAQPIRIDNHENGFVYQVAEVVDCIRANKRESDVIPLAESVRIMAVLDKIRAELGVIYPFE